MLDLFLAAGVTAAAPSMGGLGEMWGHIVTDLGKLNSWPAFWVLLQILALDLILAGDNAIVVGALAAGLPDDQRRKVIAIGVVAALVLRIMFALMVTWLMGIIGLVLVGGLLLLWVAWKMARDLGVLAVANPGSPEIAGDEASNIPAAKSFAAAAWAVAVADVSMSLDNVLAVAGAAKDHPGLLIIGLIFAVALMGVAANIIAKYIERYKWIGWIGLAVILYVAVKMIWDGLYDPKLGVLVAMAG